MRTIKLLCVSLSLSGCTTGQEMAISAPAENYEKSHYIPLDAKGKKISSAVITAHCVIDQRTGLTWELKTDDGGIHDKDNDYRWGGAGAEKIGDLFYDDWNNFLDDTNSEKLCGFSDWRIPDIDELNTLVVADNQPLAIDTTYFSQTLISPYWSASAYAQYPEHAQTVHFGNGASHYYNGYRGNRLPLRLVRGKLKKQ